MHTDHTLAYAGPTVILDQTFNNQTRQTTPDPPTACALVWPRANTYCVFDGRLGHGVLDSCSSSKRITFLVNWWTHRPQVRASTVRLIHTGALGVLHSLTCRACCCLHAEGPCFGGKGGRMVGRGRALAADKTMLPLGPALTPMLSLFPALFSHEHSRWQR